MNGVVQVIVACGSVDGVAILERHFRSGVAAVCTDMVSMSPAGLQRFFFLCRHVLDGNACDG